MANNSTAFILPQWLLPKEPGMTCRPHGTIIGMLALYNIISTAVSVITAGPFFFRQKQQLWSWTGQAFGRLWRCISRRPDRGQTDSTDQEPSYTEFPFWPFTMSVLGSVAISLSAPLLTGILISKSHPNANRWVLIEQWSTRPRATMFIVLINLLKACGAHPREMMNIDDSRSPPEQEDCYLETSLTAIITEFFVSFFGIKFLWDQTSIPSLNEFQSSTPCTSLGTLEGEPSNCPDMQIGANGLIMGIMFNGFLSLIFLLSLTCGTKNSKGWMALLGTLPLTTFVIYMYSWEIWASFLHNASDDMYCIEASTPIDVIYCLLPVFLGLWRLAWSTSARYHPNLPS
jgi:hypothetical protein